MSNSLSSLTDVRAGFDKAADQVRLQVVDTVSMTGCPGVVDHTWREAEYDQLASEQTRLWQAQSHAAASNAGMQAAESRASHSEKVWQVQQQRELVSQARQRLVETRTVLAGYRHRPPGAKKRCLATLAGLLVGDMAGQAGAALTFGEPYLTAIPQAIATGVAAVAAGMVGAEIRCLKDRASRATTVSGGLPESLQPWQHVFTTTVGEGLGWVKIIIGCAVVAVLGVGGSIFGLRSLVYSDLLAGLIYGMLAIAISAASIINSYFYADEIADVIDNAETDYTRELARSDQMSRDDHLAAHEQAIARQAAITAEHTVRGQAAHNHLQALKWRILANNPGVAGHGPVSSSQTALRRGDAA